MTTSSASPVPLSELSHIDAYLTDHPDAVRFIGLTPPERSVPPAPRFLFGPVPRHIPWQLFGEFSLGPTGCYVIANGRLTSDAIVLHGHTALWSQALNHPDYYVRNVIDTAGLNRGALPIRHVPGQAAAIFGPGYPVYGHWLVDFLPRLHVLQQTGFDLRRLTFVLPHDLPAFGFEFLRLVGIPDGNILRHSHDHEQLQFDELLLPTILRTASRLHPSFAAASRSWIERVVGSGAATPARSRLFVSRADVRSGRILGNRDALEAMARQAGFDIVHPELLPLPDQIRLFRAARQVVGEYGSGLHGTVFGTAGLTTMVLRGTSVAPGFVQSGLASAAWQSLGYVFGASDPHAVEYVFNIDERDFELGLACLELMPS